MKRYTETKLDKIIRIGLSRIDQVFDKCCEDLEKERPINSRLTRPSGVAVDEQVRGYYEAIDRNHHLLWQEMARQQQYPVLSSYAQRKQILGHNFSCFHFGNTHNISG